MAAVGSTVLTLLDFAKGLDPNGRVANVIELLAITNEILIDLPWKEGNLPTGHRTTVRTALPSVTWRLLNNGVVPSKSTKAQIDDACGKLESWSEVDVALAKLNGDVGAFRLSEAKAFLEAMNQEFASVLFYGNSGVNPEKFTGLSPRYGTLSTVSGTLGKQNIIDGGGTGSANTSVWLVLWGENTAFGIYPKGSTAGLQANDFGEQTVQLSTGIGTSRMRAFQEQFVWDCGIAIEDWRYIVRLCNIDVNNLVAEVTPTDLQNKMIRMLNRIPNLAMGRACFYMNRTVFEMLDIQRREDVRTGGQLKYEDVDGKNTPTFRGIPIRRCDSLLNTESRVT
ncbi:MAG TPA: hypothetical protein VF787_03275 [Thermoanaerobaculia bacterium]